MRLIRRRYQLVCNVHRQLFYRCIDPSYDEPAAYLIIKIGVRCTWALSIRAVSARNGDVEGRSQQAFRI